MEKIYNKLVRDKIPLIIANKGAKVKHRVLSPEEYKEALKTKLLEEVNELLKATDKAEMTEELADVMEVLEGIRKVEEISEYDVAKMQHTKYTQKGGFLGRIFLESVEEKCNGRRQKP